jgi:hypothetical protein
LLRDSIRQGLDFKVMHCPKYHEQIGFEPARHIKDSRNLKTSNHVLHHPSEQVRQNIEWYDASASNFSTDAECIRLSGTGVGSQSENIMRGMARNWVAQANQMDRLAEHDLVIAAHLALAR